MGYDLGGVSYQMGGPVSQYLLKSNSSTSKSQIKEKLRSTNKSRQKQQFSQCCVALFDWDAVIVIQKVCYHCCTTVTDIKLPIWSFLTFCSAFWGKIVVSMSDKLEGACTELVEIVWHRDLATVFWALAVNWLLPSSMSQSAVFCAQWAAGSAEHAEGLAMELVGCSWTCVTS